MLFAHIKIVFAEHNRKSFRTSYFIPGVWLSHSSEWQLCKWAINSGWRRVWNGGEAALESAATRWLFLIRKRVRIQRSTREGLHHCYVTGLCQVKKVPAPAAPQTAGSSDIFRVFAAHISRRRSSTPIIRQTKFETTIIMIFTEKNFYLQANNNTLAVINTLL